jgi:hypothetical protein
LATQEANAIQSSLAQVSEYPNDIVKEKNVGSVVVVDTKN